MMTISVVLRRIISPLFRYMNVSFMLGVTETVTMTGFGIKYGMVKK
jgi:hypothetical protein